MKHDIQQYQDNWGIWLAGFRKAHAYAELNNWSIWREVLFYAYWLANVGVNTLTGGDPEEAISSRVYKDRKDNLFAKGLNEFIEFMFDDNKHGETVKNPDRGEGSVTNRELSGAAQMVLIATVGALLLWFIGLPGLFAALLLMVVIGRICVSLIDR